MRSRRRRWGVRGSILPWISLARTVAFAVVVVAVVVVLPLTTASANTFDSDDNDDSDRVRSLPGWDGPLPSAWYSGYLEYELPIPAAAGGGGKGRTVHTHYVYVEVQPKSNFKAKSKSELVSSSGRERRDGGGGRGGGLEEEGSPTRTSAVLRRAREGTSNEEEGFGENGRGAEGTDDGIDDDELDDDDDVANDDDIPLVFWSNGGPGASSLFGVLTELGPFLLNDDSLRTESYHRTGVPSLLSNPSSWHALGSLLIFDAPAPVGYSYCDDVGGDGTSCGGWDDDTSAENNYAALMKFYDKFPELMKRPLYLTGESYAGIYVPRFARRILEHNAAVVVETRREGRDISAPDFLIPLRGFAVGDACAGLDVNCGGAHSPWFHLEFAHGHHQISLKLHSQVLETCTAEVLKRRPSKEHPIPKECEALLKRAGEQMDGYYAYGLYDDCTYRNGLARKRRLWRSAAAINAASSREDSVSSIWAEFDAKGALNDYACGGGPVLDRYLRIPSVMSSLHVPPDANFINVDNGNGFNYTPTEPNLMPFYIDVAKGKYDISNGGIHPRMLVYNGDTDPGLNSFAAENWTSSLGLDEAEEWTAWTMDGCRRMGGYVTRYEGGFDFLTIRGAGHMVPTHKPEAALAFLDAWIKNERYPKFDPDCPHP